MKNQNQLALLLLTIVQIAVFVPMAIFNPNWVARAFAIGWMVVMVTFMIAFRIRGRWRRRSSGQAAVNNSERRA